MVRSAPPPTPRTSATPLPSRPSPLTIDSRALFQGSREIRIAHDGTIYRLTITRLNKLILTK
ncbi:hemin uptake protein HemP [Stappia sp. F7233]|uniref:Hemin uptake protein HemP n=1 Tax=Stappia albiluteola TaxID=2758565 RepID=A0A839AB50_9HYPH|nr:hemin uptake protein HemP [Stappia albiluteola]MBA5776172.1 hemin uptake protein HemP [Stappia albiluteola]